MTQIGGRTTGGIVKIAVATGGGGYTSSPAILLTGGGGTGATAYAVMAGTMVDSVIVYSAGTGYTSAPTVSFSGGGGTGAAGTATVYAGSMRYLSFFKGRYNDMYGVDGMGRGIRWNGDDASVEHIGIHRPLVGPTLTAASGTTSSVIGIQIVNGGAGYNNPPLVSFSGGGGSGAVAAASIANGRVSSVSIVSPGSGYTAAPAVSFSGGIGSGASFGVGVVGGLARVRAVSPAVGGVANVTLTTGGDGYQGTPSVAFSGGGGTGAAAVAVTHRVVTSVSVTSGGTGYSSAPSVVFSGGGGTGAAATCDLAGTAVANVYITSGGTGYTAAPTVAFSGGSGSGAQAGAVMSTQVATVTITTSGSGYTSNPTVSFNGGSPATTAVATAAALTALTTGAAIVWHNTNGLTGQNASLIISPLGRLLDVVLSSAGTGCTATGVTAGIAGAPGIRPFEVDQFFAVSSVTAVSSGSGYMAAPVITVLPDKTDIAGGGAALTCTVNTTGNISGVTVLAGGTFTKPPTAVILDTTAKATATLKPPLKGKYRCCFRYLDDTPESQGGPIPSSISELKEVDATAGSSVLTWTLSTAGKDARATHVELWRTSADQSVILFRVATLAISGLSAYSDTLSDKDLTDTTRDGYGLMPVTLPSGQVNARRFGVPPAEFAVGCMFQDRAWYGVDVTGQRPNALVYSEVDEPESVPDENELIIQENTAEPDKLVALIPLGSMLLLVQTAHLYRLTYVAQPVIDAAIVLAGYRGALNSRCWDVIGGVAFIVDSNGMYAYDGQSEEAVSAPIDNYWRDKIIDFSQAEKFHVRADLSTRTVRFYYCKSGDSNPTRALCYCVATKAWWEETYPSAITATVRLPVAGKQEAISGTASGSFLKTSGASDSGTAIPYEFRTGALPLSAESGSRAITFLYKPTASDSTLKLRLAYNNSATPRANAIASDRGSGFVTTTGSTDATLNMKLTRSPLGDANGMARANYAGRIDPASAGGDRHVAVLVGGTAAEEVVLHTIAVDGAG